MQESHRRSWQHAEMGAGDLGGLTCQRLGTGFAGIIHFSFTTFPKKNFLRIYSFSSTKPGHSLQNRVSRSRPYGWEGCATFGEDVMFYVACIIEGLGHLHERKIAHRCLGLARHQQKLRGKLGCFGRGFVRVYGRRFGQMAHLFF